MRNILMTVMLLIVVVVIFSNVITSEDGTKNMIESKGTAINSEISNLLNP